MTSEESVYTQPILAHHRSTAKEHFFERMNREIEAVKARYPDAIIVGLADGATCNWDFLKEHTTHQTLDFYHAAEYLAKAADALYPSCYIERSRWLDDACLRLR